MKIKKSSGPQIEPWRTPQSTERLSDNLLLKVTYCCHFERYDLNQSKAILASCALSIYATELRGLRNRKLWKNLEILKLLSNLYLGYHIY